MFCTCLLAYILVESCSTLFIFSIFFPTVLFSSFLEHGPKGGVSYTMDLRRHFMPGRIYSICVCLFLGLLVFAHVGLERKQGFLFLVPFSPSLPIRFRSTLAHRVSLGLSLNIGAQQALTGVEDARVCTWTWGPAGFRAFLAFSRKGGWWLVRKGGRKRGRTSSGGLYMVRYT